MSTERDWYQNEYAADIHKYLRTKEHKKFLFRGQSPQLPFRNCMLKWLKEVCNILKFSTTVQHLAIYYLDIYMDNHTIHYDHLQMVLASVLIVAVKVEEKDSLIPRISKFNECIENKYKLKEFLKMEMDVLTFFNWDLLYPTTAHFIEYYTLFASNPSDSLDGSVVDYEEVQMYIKKYIEFFLELSTQDVIFHKFCPSLVAASCILATRMCLVISPPWPETLQSVTQYKYTQLKSCVGLLMRAIIT